MISQSTNSINPQNSNSSNKNRIIILLLLLIIAALIGYFFFSNNKTSQVIDRAQAISIVEKELEQEFDDTEEIEFGQIQELSDLERETQTVYEGIEVGDYYLILKTTGKLAFIDNKTQKIIRIDEIKYR